MLILQINKNLITLKAVKLQYFKNLLKKFKNQLKKLKTFKNIRYIISKENFLINKSLKPINYIVGVNIYKTNVVIYVSNVKGEINFFYTAGSLNLKKNQKKKKIVIITKLLKILLTNVSFISKKDIVALHLYNFNEGLVKVVYSFLIKHYNLEVVQVNNNQPHNGCRPRKLKRKKRRKLNFIKNEEMTEWFKVADCKSVRFFLS